MTTIRERDAAAERCVTCHQAGGPLWGAEHEQTAAECSARLMEESGGRRGCWTPEDHHPYKAGPPVEDADLDRRALLRAGDRLAAATRLWHGTLRGHGHPGCCDVGIAVDDWKAVTG